MSRRWSDVSGWTWIVPKYVVWRLLTWHGTVSSRKPFAAYALRYARHAAMSVPSILWIIASAAPKRVMNAQRNAGGWVRWPEEPGARISSLYRISMQMRSDSRSQSQCSGDVCFEVSEHLRLGARLLFGNSHLHGDHDGGNHGGHHACLHARYVYQ